ncbi:MAG: 2-C-methyl-D-erythritol 4-phosphate cytidylyltransferase [Rhodothermales bacterium]|nr:2-C-methyl-D-erythritol 4-phosphate cytidylyltransferase [Rhodothermales bacterium]
MGGRAKQYRLLGNKPVLIQSIRAFIDHPDVDGVVVAVPANSIEATQRLIEAEGFRRSWSVVEGGETRQQSVSAALASVPTGSRFVLIHDAVRPFVSRELLDRIILTAKSYGAACPAVPVADTLRRAQEGVFGETVDRTDLYQIQTPQAFDLEKIQKAHLLAREADQTSTDAVELYQRFIGEVRLVPGSAENFKITRPEDWRTAERAWADFINANETPQ